uniref:uncharacterized protein LOC122587140 n=1 Tax=Erigeron canadensis TaxID=72917 RepID=UPI001CB8BAB6|nr:uncharacterized protein LOC122587140 [Erigeron canadensis]
MGSVKNDTWKLYTDGAASSNGCGAGLMLISPEEKEFTYALRFEFKVTNNEAKYEALLAVLRIARDMRIRNIQVYVNSQLVAYQVKGTYEAKQGTTKLYLQKVHELIEYFSHFEIEHIRRNQKKKADALSKLVSLTFGHLGKQVLVEVLKARLIGEKQISDLVEEEGKTWMTPIYENLVSGILPADRSEARKIRVKAPQYKILDKKLYKKGFVTPWLRCVGPKQAEMIIREIHEGICGAHSGARSWGIDLVGPLPKGQNKKKFLVVAIDYFTKWVEAKPLATTNRDQIKKFIKQSFTSVYHPQGNVQVEVTNREIIKGIEKRLGRSHKGWIDELPSVLWANRTKPKRSNGETPFSLAYGMEAVAPAEFQVSTYRTLNTEGNSKELRVDLDLLEE